MTNIIITGGLGFIGSHIAERLTKRGYFPIIIDNFFNGKTKNLGKLSRKSFVIFKNDINDKKTIIKKIAKYQVRTIIHLAAIHYIPFCVAHPKDVFRANIFGTKSIIEIAKKAGIERILFASSAAVYKPKYSRHRETDKLGAVDIYGVSKIKGEDLIKRSGLNYTIFRFFNVYGPRDSTPHFIPSLISRLFKGSKIRIGDINTIRDYIYIDDVVGAVEKALDNPNIALDQTYNVGAGRGYLGRDVLDILKKRINKDANIFFDRRLFRRVDRRVLIANCIKIKQALSWEPKVDFKNGLNKTLNNFE